MTRLRTVIFTTQLFPPTPALAEAGASTLLGTDNSTDSQGGRPPSRVTRAQDQKLFLFSHLSFQDMWC